LRSRSRTGTDHAGCAGQLTGELGMRFFQTHRAGRPAGRTVARTVAGALAGAIAGATLIPLAAVAQAPIQITLQRIDFDSGTCSITATLDNGTSHHIDGLGIVLTLMEGDTPASPFPLNFQGIEAGGSGEVTVHGQVEQCERYTGYRLSSVVPCQLDGTMQPVGCYDMVAVSGP
jgi:hypothetical protein